MGLNDDSVDSEHGVEGFDLDGSSGEGDSRGGAGAGLVEEVGHALVGGNSEEGVDVCGDKGDVEQTCDLELGGHVEDDVADR